MLHSVLVSADGLLGERSRTKVKALTVKQMPGGGEFRPPQEERKLSSGNKKDSQHFPHLFSGESIASMPESLLAGMKFLISSDVSSER